MIGKNIDWDEISRKHGNSSIVDLIKEFRKSNLSYSEIGEKLGVSTTAIWNKTIKLLEQNQLKPGEIICQKRKH
jgi:hypothetical protein